MATSLVIKLSVANSAPAAGSLFAGEQAYSFVSNTLFIGAPDGSVQNTGGYFYTQIIDSRTSQAIPNTLVLIAYNEVNPVVAVEPVPYCLKPM